ncbi:MAG: hypothetical protein ACAH11_05960 [Sphingomonas sp.]
MRLLKLMLAGLLMLLPFPALADITAHYGVGPKDKLVVEADGGGSLRASFGDRFALIRRDGVYYAVLILPNGEAKVADAAAVVDVVAGQMKGQMPTAMGGMMFEMKQGGESSHAGFGGTTWLFGPVPGGPERPNEKPFEVLITTDPALAPVGIFFHRFSELMGPMLGLVFGGNTNLGPLATELFAKGTPLKIGDALTLETIDRAEIPADRFELPGPVIQPIEFLQAVMPSESGAGLPALP